MIDSVEAFILAGGKSRRMGTPKALLEVGGKPIIVRMVGALQEVFQQIAVVTNRSEEVAFLGLPVLPDIHPDHGPMGGLQAALAAALTDTIFLVSADLPFLTSAFIRALHAHHGESPITIPSSGGRLHPLCGFYERLLVSDVTRRVESEELSMRNLVENTRHRVVQQDELAGHELERVLFNVNTPEELARARGIVEAGNSENPV